MVQQGEEIKEQIHTHAQQLIDQVQRSERHLLQQVRHYSTTKETLANKTEGTGWESTHPAQDLSGYGWTKSKGMESATGDDGEREHVTSNEHSQSTCWPNSVPAYWRA